MSTTRSISEERQKKAFATVFLIELWERFGFYGMQVLIIYYMVQQLHFHDHRANLVWGAAAALIYVSPAIGGWLGDKILGTRRCMLMGAGVLALGYALMTLPASDTWILFGAIGVIIVGNGLFKSNAGTLVRKIFEGDDSRLDSAFTIYYMAVNIGSAVSQLLAPWVKDYVNATYGHGYGWHAAFAICCFGLLIGLGNYAVMRTSMHNIGSEPDTRPVSWSRLSLVILGALLAVALSALILNYEMLARAFVGLAGLSVIAIFWYLIRTGEHRERAGLIAAFILIIQTLFFFVFYQQMSSSLALFALRNVDPNFSIFGMHLWAWSPAQFQALNPLWIMLLSPLLATLYTKAGARGRDPSIATKFAMGFACVAIGFFIYASAGWFAVGGKADSWVMIWGYGMGALGELLVSGLGLAMMARFVPERMSGFMMGSYFVASGCSQYIGGLIANMASIPEGITQPTQTLPIYTDLFFKLGIAGIICMLIALAVLPWIKRLERQHTGSVPA